VVNLSLGEEDTFPDTSWDGEIAQKLFNDLNHGLLRPPDDGNVIILSDSEEEEEEEEEDVREDDHTYADIAPSSTMNSLTPTFSAAADDDAFDGVQDGSSGGGDEIGIA
jgi:hypothetical protein